MSSSHTPGRSPPWQDQQTMDNLRNSNRSSVFGSIKSSFMKRKNSARSTISVSPTTPTLRTPTLPVSGTSMAPVELAADLYTINIAAQSNSDRNPLQNPSPATRRPDRPGMNAFTTPSNEPPPAYTESPNVASGPPLSLSPGYTRESSPAPSARSGMTQAEDPYAFLSSFDTIILIDDSGSMAGRSWRETKQALSSLLPTILSHDKDGVDLFFLNHVSSDLGDTKAGIAPGGYRNVSRVSEVDRIFKTVKPGAGTPTGQRCRAILRPYLALLEAEAKKGKIDDVKPLNILAITDGVPSDDVESVLLNAAKKLDALDAAPHQIGVQFFQVGNEEGAKEALIELDDGLVGLVAGGVRDMVDTCTWMGGSSEDGQLKLTSEGILKVVLGAVVKRLDRRRCSAELARI